MKNAIETLQIRLNQLNRAYDDFVKLETDKEHEQVKINRELAKQHEKAIYILTEKHYTIKELISFGSYLISDTRAKNVIHKDLVHDADLKNWEHLVSNIKNN